MMVNNSSSIPSNILSTPTVHIVLNIISLIATAIGTLISFIVLVGVLLRKKTFHDLQLLLCANNYILVFCLGIFELIQTVNILRGDFGFLIMDEETIECRLMGYILFSFISTVYLACVLQAIFRLCRIVYPTMLWLLEVHTYLIIIPIMWITSFILVSPLFIWHGIVLISGDYICLVTKHSPFHIAYSTLIVYGVPFNILAITYFQVHRFLHRQSRTTMVALASRSRHRQRDIIVFRRIVIIVTLLGSYGMPNSVMLIMFAITHDLVSSFYRIIHLSFAACVLTLSIALLYANPQVKNEIKIFQSKTRVAPIGTREFELKQRTNDRSQMRTVTRTL